MISSDEGPSKSLNSLLARLNVIIKRVEDVQSLPCLTTCSPSSELIKTHFVTDQSIQISLSTYRCLHIEHMQPS